MSTFERALLALAVAAAIGSFSGAAAEGPGLGTPINEADAAAIDFVVMPDGRGLPEGSGDAHQGLEVYQRECRICHGDGGQGGPNDRLTGGRGSLASDQPVKTIGSYWPHATTVFDYVRRAMPYHQPGNLSADEVYAVTAYLLAENDVIERDRVLNAETLPAVQMPNREGFSWAWPSD
jgi:cytochrome c